MKFPAALFTSNIHSEKTEYSPFRGIGIYVLKLPPFLRGEVRENNLLLLLPGILQLDIYCLVLDHPLTKGVKGVFLVLLHSQMLACPRSHLHWAKRKAPLTERLDYGLSTRFLLFSAPFSIWDSNNDSKQLTQQRFLREIVDGPRLPVSGQFLLAATYHHSFLLDFPR